jgi:hypothetical protein
MTGAPVDEALRGWTSKVMSAQDERPKATEGQMKSCRIRAPHLFGGSSGLAGRRLAITGRRPSALRALLVGKGVEMIHSVEFLDRAGKVIRTRRVEAPDDPSAFRIVACDWPRAAYCVRILPLYPAAGVAPEVGEPRRRRRPR